MPALKPGFLTAIVEQFKDELLDNVRDELRSNAPRKTGRLARSFDRRGKDEVVSTAPYAVIVDQRRPYIDRSLRRAVNSTEVKVNA